MKIAALDPARAAEVAAVSAECFDAPWSADELRREAERAVGRVVVACEADAVIGYGVAHVIGSEAEVITLGVLPRERRRGVGRALLAALVEGAARAFLEVRAGDPAATGLYAGFGFAEVDRRVGYYADGEDAVIMAWSRPSPA